MGQNSEILWTEHTFNPWWGCVKVSEGCANCYAETFSKRVGFKIWGQDADRRFFGDKHWSEPVRWNTAAAKLGVMHRVFCGSMCDVFEDRPGLEDPRLTVQDMADALPNLLWLFLTKRPQNVAAMLPKRWADKWPRNVMIGVTIENQQRLEERLPPVIELHRLFPGIQTFASCEPLLSALNWESGNTDRLEYFDWVVAGGESGHKARPCHPDWAGKLRNDCGNRTDMGRPWPVPFLWKQWGEFGPWIDHQKPIDSPGRRYVWADGKVRERGESNGGIDFRDAAIMERVGKAVAGHILDGKEHREAPRLSYGPQVAELVIE